MSFSNLGFDVSFLLYSNVGPSSPESCRFDRIPYNLYSSFLEKRILLGERVLLLEVLLQSMRLSRESSFGHKIAI